jgi:molybdopterin synthase catalytic subunit
MTGRVVLTGISDEDLDPDAVLASVDDPAAGAVVSFVGRVRNHDGGRAVTALEYHEHPTAAAVVATVAGEIAVRDGVLAVSAIHRTGLLQIGGIAVVAAVSAEHRGQAFAACADLIDEIKVRLPVWKRQVFDGGSEEWVGSA